MAEKVERPLRDAQGTSRKDEGENKLWSAKYGITKRRLGGCYQRRWGACEGEAKGLKARLAQSYALTPRAAWPHFRHELVASPSSTGWRCGSWAAAVLRPMW